MRENKALGMLFLIAIVLFGIESMPLFRVPGSTTEPATGTEPITGPEPIAGPVIVAQHTSPYLTYPEAGFPCSPSIAQTCFASVAIYPGPYLNPTVLSANDAEGTCFKLNTDQPVKLTSADFRTIMSLSRTRVGIFNPSPSSVYNGVCAPSEGNTEIAISEIVPSSLFGGGPDGSEGRITSYDFIGENQIILQPNRYYGIAVETIELGGFGGLVLVKTETPPWYSNHCGLCIDPIKWGWTEGQVVHGDLWYQVWGVKT